MEDLTQRRKGLAELISEKRTMEDEKNFAPLREILADDRKRKTIKL